MPQLSIRDDDQRSATPPGEESLISVRGVSAGYDNVRTATRLIALRDIDLEIRRGEFLAIVGPSGCGKTTLINMIAGFVAPLEGTITVGGREVTGPGPDRAMVFQDYALLPWRTVEANVHFALENPSVNLGREESKARVAEVLELVGLGGFGKSFPHQLSGGMQQRVGIARALVTRPDILLMDEPFGAVDAMTREAMQAEFEKIIAASGQTVVFITHSIDEAVALGDRVVVISSRPGHIKEVIDIDLPRSRFDDEVKRDPRFADYTQHIWGLLRDEALGAKKGK
jgi:NitT/TauT family transport system ATP-binding protein